MIGADAVGLGLRHGTGLGEVLAALQVELGQMKRGLRLRQLRAELGIINLDEHLVLGDVLALLKLHGPHLPRDFRPKLGGFIGRQGTDQGERLDQVPPGDLGHLHRLPERGGNGGRPGRLFPAAGRQDESHGANDRGPTGKE